MFLDISFVGASGYRKDGYSKIYSSWRKQRRMSICVEEDNAQQNFTKSLRDENNNQRKEQYENLNMSLPYLSSEHKAENLNKRYKKKLARSLAKYRQSQNSNRNCEKCCCCNHGDNVRMNKSLVMLDQDPMQQKLTSANSVNSIVAHVGKTIEQDEVDRVASWAVSFDKLLQDAIGITVFTDFLKKEFSDENVEFWKACESYKAIMDSNFRKSKAREIYDKYVSVRAPDAVNIDSVARKDVEGQLDSPTSQTFDSAQLHIFQLMKQDSYARFLKSDLYKTYMMNEMEGKPLEAPETEHDKQKILDKVNEKDAKKKGKGKENEENKRRRSLLPWRQKSKKQPKSDDKDKKSKKETKDINANNTTPTTSDPVPVVTSTKDVVKVEVPETITEEEPEQPRFCRVIMPDGSTTVVGTKQGQTINYILGKLCEKRGLSIASVDVFLLGNEKPLNLNDDISTLGSKEVTIERRVLFRMDLPNKKSIGVKAKPNRLIKDVFKPILNKYGYKIDTIDVHLSGQLENLCLDNLVSTIDSQRVIILNQATELPGPDRRNSATYGTFPGSSGSYDKGYGENREIQTESDIRSQEKHSQKSTR